MNTNKLIKGKEYLLMGKERFRRPGFGFLEAESRSYFIKAVYIATEKQTLIFDKFRLTRNGESHFNEYLTIDDIIEVKIS